MHRLDWAWGFVLAMLLVTLAVRSATAVSTPPASGPKPAADLTRYLQLLREPRMPLAPRPAPRAAPAVPFTPEGLRVTALTPGSFPSRLGLQNGDVIQRVNGVALTTPGEALQAWLTLSAPGVASVHIQRGGTPLLLTWPTALFKY